MVQNDFFSMFLQFDVDMDEFNKTKVCKIDEDSGSDCDVEDYRDYFCNALEVQLRIYHTSEKETMLSK